MSTIIQPVILCGGGGTRLWPISTLERPKQLLTIGGESLLERTLSRVAQLAEDNWKQPLLVMNEQHRNGYAYPVIYEPYSNDTAVAILRAARAAEPGTYLVIFPADHYIFQLEPFLQDLRGGLREIDQESILLFGLAPTSPENKYGYIIPTEEGVVFREKPSVSLAKYYITQGALWNSGIFGASRELLLELLQPWQDWLDHPRPGKAPSFDIAVLQEYPKIKVYPGQGWSWSDVGTWDSFLLLPEVITEMRQNPAIMEECSNVTVLHRGQGKTVVLGCQDLIIVHEGDNTLIMQQGSDQSGMLKRVIEQQMSK